MYSHSLTTHLSTLGLISFKVKLMHCWYTETFWKILTLAVIRSWIMAFSLRKWSYIVTNLIFYLLTNGMAWGHHVKCLPQPSSLWHTRRNSWTQIFNSFSSISQKVFYKPCIPYHHCCPHTCKYWLDTRVKVCMGFIIPSDTVASFINATETNTEVFNLLLPWNTLLSNICVLWSQ